MQEAVIHADTPPCQVPKLEPIRIPMNQEMAPAEENFDQIVAMLKDTTASCPVIFNCQVSKFTPSRSASSAASSM